MKPIIAILFATAIFVPALAQKNKKGAKINLPQVNVVETPVVKWVSYPGDTTTVAQNIQTFACTVNSRVPLKQIEIMVNGITTDVYNTVDFARAVGPNKYEQLIESTVTLRTGANTISVIAINDRDIKKESLKRVMVDPNQITMLRNVNDKTPPMIYVSNPVNIKNDYTVEYTSFTKITGTVIDEAGVRELRINNIVTPLKANGAFMINLPLIVGDNSITIEVTDLNQNIALKKFVIARKNMEGSDYIASKAKNYLLIIGINNYKQWPTLYNAAQDAKAVKKVLTSQYTFDPENVTILIDSQATRFKIYEALRAQIEKITSRDNLLIYYSGHGYFDKLLSEGYWVPVDAIKGDVSSYVSNSQILKIIENINSQHTFLVADACFSGSLFSATSRGYTDHVEKYKSRWGLASGRLEEVSDGLAGTNSPFAQSFIEFLQTNANDKVAVSDLVQFVKKKVTEANQQTPIGNPLKGVGDEGGELVFYRRTNK